MAETSPAVDVQAIAGAVAAGVQHALQQRDQEGMDQQAVPDGSSTKYQGTIKVGDANFLPLLGRGTVASSLAEWRQRVTTHSGLLVRRVKDDSSNIHGYTIGEERIYTKLDATKSKSYSGSGSVAASGAAGGVPVSGSLNASASSSNVENLSSTDHAIVTRTYAFKGETPSFPTELEKDLYKWIAECLGQMRRPSFVYNPTEDPVKKVEDYVAKLIPGKHSSEWQEIEEIVEAYIAKKEVTDYVFSIALGVKEAESSHSTKKHTQKSGGGSIGATGTSVGFSAKGEKKDDKSQQQKQVIGRVKVSEETGDVSIEGEGVVKVGVIGISDLIQSVEIRGIVERKAEEYKTRLIEKENCYAPLVGPIVISCKQRINGPGSELREVFWEVKEDGVVGGTTDGEKASRFYLDDKGNGRFCIHYYDETSDVQHRECNSRRLYVRRSQLPNAAQIRVAVSDGEYDKVQDLVFNMATRFRDTEPYSVNDWPGKGDMVYLTVSQNRFLWWDKKFYIRMDYTNDGATPPKFTFSFSFADAIAINRNSSLLFFCSKPSAAQPDTASATPTGGSHAVAPPPSIASATPTGPTAHTHDVALQPTGGGTGPPTSSDTDGTIVKGAEPTLQVDDTPQAPASILPYKQSRNINTHRGQLLDGGSVDSDEDPEPD